MPICLTLILLIGYLTLILIDCYLGKIWNDSFAAIKYIPEAGELSSGNTGILDIHYNRNEFTLHNMSVTLDGRPYTRVSSPRTTSTGETIMEIGPMADQSDSGVYGWRYYLVERKSQNVLVVSSYTAIMIKGKLI